MFHQIYDTLDERYAYIPPDDEMFGQVKRLVSSVSGEEAAEHLEIHGVCRPVIGFRNIAYLTPCCRRAF